MVMHTALGLLNELAEEDVDWIIRAGSERQVIANTVVVREDEPLAYLYIVLEGLFAVRLASVPEAEIGRLGPGEIIGEISFLEHCLPSASVIAVESSLLLEIPNVNLAEKLKTKPAFGAQFYRALAILNSRRMRERVTSLTTSLHAKLDPANLGGDTSQVFFAGIERFKSLLLRADGEGLKNNGQISVYSEPGKGTSFKIYLPALETPLELAAGVVITSFAPLTAVMLTSTL